MNGRTHILGTGHFAPERVLTNAELERMVDTTDAWIVERTGIRERRRAEPGTRTSALATEAGRRAMASAGVGPADIAMVIVATVTGDHQMPATACYVQHALGIKHAPAFDISAACAGFIYGLDLGDRYLRTGGGKRVLVIGVEYLTKVLDWNDRSTCVLFGDAAGAVVLGESPDPAAGILSTHIFTDGALADALTIPFGGTVQMNGREIFKAAVRHMSEAGELALRTHGFSAADVTLVFAHQANLRIVEAVAERSHIPMERVYVNLERFGNTSSASIPVALDEALSLGRVKRGDLLLLTALGGGVSWGSALVRW